MGMFERVAEMNTLFGNSHGAAWQRSDPFEKIPFVVKCIRSEVVELETALLNSDLDKALDGVRDGLCDILVFALGAFHDLGIDANRDMDVVVDAVLTRFCKDEQSLIATCAKYDALGVRYYAEGTYPYVCLKSAEDQGDEYPKGKFLKAVGYKTPTFEAVP